MSDLAAVKVGDKLLVKAGRYDSQIVTVDRITPSGRVVTKLGEFNPNGSKRGGRNSWFPVRARLATEDEIAGIYRNDLVRSIEQFRSWDKLSAEDLKAVSEIVSKFRRSE